jgi:hypothetical protein
MGQKSEQVIALLNSARAQVDEVYARLPEAARVANGTWEAWAPKDFLGHFNFWQNSLLNNLSALDQPPQQQESFDVRNERNYRHNEFRPYADVYADYASSFEKIIARASKT